MFHVSVMIDLEFFYNTESILGNRLMVTVKVANPGGVIQSWYRINGHY